MYLLVLSCENKLLLVSHVRNILNVRVSSHELNKMKFVNEFNAFKAKC
jgi:hypothetical protein